MIIVNNIYNVNSNVKFINIIKYRYLYEVIIINIYIICLLIVTTPVTKFSMTSPHTNSLDLDQYNRERRRKGSCREDAIYLKQIIDSLSKYRDKKKSIGVGIYGNYNTGYSCLAGRY